MLPNGLITHRIDNTCAQNRLATYKIHVRQLWLTNVLPYGRVQNCADRNLGRKNWCHIFLDGTVDCELTTPHGDLRSDTSTAEVNKRISWNTCKIVKRFSGSIHSPTKASKTFDTLIKVTLESYIHTYTYIYIYIRARDLNMCRYCRYTINLFVSSYIHIYIYIYI